MPATSENNLSNLQQVHDLHQKGSKELAHVFGILRWEMRRKEIATHLEIFDEYKQVTVKLTRKIGELDYPKLEPGDIVRIHRLRVDGQHLESTAARNVVVWPAFKHDPKPAYTARNPTLTDEDYTRRRILEAYFCTRIAKIVDIYTSRQVSTIYEFVAGMFESASTDPFGHLEIVFTDGTAKGILRVFRKDKQEEVQNHFIMAEKLTKGQYFLASNVKYDGKRLNLSANLLYGRSLRLVEPSSILGTKLTESLAQTVTVEASQKAAQSKQDSPTCPKSKISDQTLEEHKQQQQQQQPPPQQPTSNATSNGASQLRRSPRLNNQTQDENRPDNEQHETSRPHVEEIEDYANPNNDRPPPPPIQQPLSPAEKKHPSFTLYKNIQRKDNGYEFYELVGQVRDEPHINPNYGNCILQIFDGSLHPFPNFYSHEVQHPIIGCLILCVYSKQKESDTNEHWDKAVALKEGDIVYITNVKVSFVGGKIKPELSANKSHNKSILVVDKQSSFGKHILTLVETPQVAELTDHNDTSDDFYRDSDDESTPMVE